MVKEIDIMKLSAKAVTALKLFIDLGEHKQDGFISLKDVSQRKNVSKKFLEQIVPIYKNNGLLICNRGNQGGYALSKETKDISAKDIIYVAENNFNNEKIDFVSIDSLMENINKLIDDYFQNISLQDLIDKQKENYSYDFSI